MLKLKLQYFGHLMRRADSLEKTFMLGFSRSVVSDSFVTPWTYAAQLFATQWTAACQASLSFSTSRRLLKPMSTESVMPSSHLVLCHPLLLPSIFPSSGKGPCAEITIKTVLGKQRITNNDYSQKKISCDIT